MEIRSFQSLIGIEFLVKYDYGCSQDMSMRLYRVLVIPTMDYGAAEFFDSH